MFFWLSLNFELDFVYEKSILLVTGIKTLYKEHATNKEFAKAEATCNKQTE